MPEFSKTNDIKINTSYVEPGNVEIHERFRSPHDILGKEYEFNGVSFTVLGMEPEFFDGDETTEDLQPNTVVIVNIQKQRIPVIPFQGGMARITKIQIGDEVIVGYVEIIKYIENVEQAPGGWMTNKGLAEELKVGKETVSVRAKKYRLSNLEWFRNYRFPGHSVCEHYSPELCALIRKELFTLEQAPKGWMTNGGIANELKVGAKTVVKYAEFFRQSHSDWFHIYKYSIGKPAEHYAPQLCDIIRHEIVKVEHAPEGWMTCKSLVKELKVGWNTVANIANNYHQYHPELFCDYKDAAGRVCEHFAPQLCDIIRNEIVKVEHAPEGWMTCKSLAHQLGINASIIFRFANFYHESNPEWFHDYKNTFGKNYEHYAPELCEIIKSECGKIEYAPVGWMTLDGLTKELKVGRETIIHHANFYHTSHPDWFGEYMSQNGKKLEHYSSEFSKMLRDELLKVEQAPEGWITNFRLARELNTNERTTTYLAKQYHQEHSEWFGEYKNHRGHVYNYYSPELCDIIRQEMNDKRS